MPNLIKSAFLTELGRRYGPLRKLPQSRSLFEVSDSRVRVYIRYSKVHDDNQTFFGLRDDDLRQLQGHPSVICFLWKDQKSPLVIPFEAYEQVFRTTGPARDGQYKTQVYLQTGGGTELYVARAGRFNVEGNFGWSHLDDLTRGLRGDTPLDFSHFQMQTLLGAIGVIKGYDVWIPAYDQTRLDWSLASRFTCRSIPPLGFQSVAHILQEIDVVWLQKGSSQLEAMFEVEHSTSIYSGLLRFNDIHLVIPNLRPTFSIVANQVRRDVFVKQLNRPTFRMNGLNELCAFLDYLNVYEWYQRIRPAIHK